VTKTTRALLASGDLAPDVSLSVVLVRHANHERIMINWPARPTTAHSSHQRSTYKLITKPC
jgi:hypothetical protein